MIEFKDYSKIVIDKINKEADIWLEEMSGQVESQTARNTKVAKIDGGKTKGSWEHVVHAREHYAEVGSRYQNALWEELGTGIYALNGNGRKTKWVYTPDGGKHYYTTVGKRPRRALWNAYTRLKNRIIRSAQQRFKNL